MANEIVLNIQNQNSTTQGITLWQLPNSNDPQVYLQEIGASTIPNSKTVLGDIMWYNNETNSYFTLDGTTKVLRQYDITLTNLLTTSSIPATYGNFAYTILYNPVNNRNYAIADIVGTPRVVSFGINGGSYLSNTILPYYVIFTIYDFINNRYYYSAGVSNATEIVIFNPITNTVSGTILGTTGYEVRCFDYVNQRLVVSDANTFRIYDVNPISPTYLTILDTFLTINGGLLQIDSSGDTFQVSYNSTNNSLYVLCQNINEIQIVECVTYSVISTFPVSFYKVITINNNLNLLYANQGWSNIDIIDCSTNTLISSTPVSGFLPSETILQTNSGNILFTRNVGLGINSSQLMLPSSTFTTQGVPSYQAIVNSVYGANPYKFTKLYISTTSLQQANQPLTINLTAPDGRLNTDLKFPSISPLQKQFVIPEFDLNMTANGQSNLQYNVLPNTDVTMIFTYEQPSSAESIEEVEVLYEDVTERFKQLEISKKNNPLLDMKWDIE